MDYPEMDYFLNESLSDVVFVVEGKRLPAIKQTLSLKSRVFRAMFSGNFSESQESDDSKLTEIEIKDTTYEAFKTMIRFIYTEVLLFKINYDLQHIWDVFQLSDRYEVLRLRHRILRIVIRFLNVKINLKDLIPITKIVFIHNIEELVPKVMICIKRRIHDLGKRTINELKELNDSTNDKLMDALTASFFVCVGSDGSLYLKYGKGLQRYEVYTEKNFMAIKAFIRLLYFDEISLNVEEDFRLIREVCDMCESVENRPLMEVIGTQLQKRITPKTLEQISGIAFDYNIDGLIEKVNEMKILFKRQNRKKRKTH